MKTINKIKVKVVVCESVPDISEMQENTIYYSETYKTASHKCLVCGILSVTPISYEWWSMDIINNDNFTMKPSILNNPCKHHYIITNGIANVV